MEGMYDFLAQRLGQGQMSYMVTVVAGPRQGESIIYSSDGQALLGEAVPGLQPDMLGNMSLLQIGDMELFVQPVEKDPEVLILGAGHVSRCISDLLLYIGCHVTVVDDREEYVQPHFFDQRVNRHCIDFAKLSTILDLQRYQAFIVVTRAHEFDRVCLQQLRPYLHQYIGVMGSKKRLFHSCDVLKRQDGWTEEEIACIYGPIGLSIGAETPEEIALSIVSEYLAVTRGKQGQSLSRRGDTYEA